MFKEDTNSVIFIFSSLENVSKSSNISNIFPSYFRIGSKSKDAVLDIIEFVYCMI